MNKCFFKAGVFIVFIFISISVRAQENPAGAGAGIEVNAVVGKVLKHEAKFELPIAPHTSALDINYTQRTYGKKAWEQRRHYPIIGFGLMYTNYGNNAVYGQLIGLYPQLQVPIVQGKNLEWTLRVGMGIGYVSQHYENYPNWEDSINNAIGSHINNFTLFGTTLRYHINAHWDVQLGGMFTHMSNAAARLPNLGINMYAANIGVRYYPVTSRPKKITRALEPLRNRWLIQYRLGLALTEGNAPDGPIYPVFLHSLYVSRRYASKNKMFAGADYAFYQSTYAFLRNNIIYPGEERAYSYKAALFVGNEFLMGRVGIMLQAGYYLKEPYAAHDIYYEKLGMNLYILRRETGFFKELTISGFLKAHAFVAELGELGIGIGI